MSGFVVIHNKRLKGFRRGKGVIVRLKSVNRSILLKRRQYEHLNQLESEILVSYVLL